MAVLIFVETESEERARNLGLIDKYMSQVVSVVC